MDGKSYFFYDLQILSHGISNISLIGYDMKSSKIGSSALSIRGDQLKELDAVKSLTKVIEILEKLLLMISSSHQY